MRFWKKIARRRRLERDLEDELRFHAVGLALGLPASMALGRALRGALVGVSPFDPLTLLGVVAILAVAGVLGCAIPARRALRVDPVEALRCE
jgi:ABC-type antimicrobial peptide transport system permease subunit